MSQSEVRVLTQESFRSSLRETGFAPERGRRSWPLSLWRQRVRKMGGAIDVLTLNIMRNPVEPRKNSDPVISEDRTDLMWVPKERLMFRISTSAPRKVSLEAIARGLDVS